MSAEVYVAGVVRERWDDTTRTYTAFNASGVQISSRPYTAAENTQANAEAVNQTAQTNKVTLLTDAKADLAVLDSSVTALNVVIAKANNTIAGGDTKQVAQEARSIARATKRLVRLITESLDATS